MELLIFFVPIIIVIPTINLFTKSAMLVTWLSLGFTIGTTVHLRIYEVLDAPMVVMSCNTGRVPTFKTPVPYCFAFVIRKLDKLPVLGSTQTFMLFMRISVSRFSRSLFKSVLSASASPLFPANWVVSWMRHFGLTLTKVSIYARETAAKTAVTASSLKKPIL